MSKSLEKLSAFERLLLLATVNIALARVLTFSTTEVKRLSKGYVNQVFSI